MTYKELLDKLSMLAPEYLERKVTLYDTLTGHLYNPKELLYIDEREETVNDPDVPGPHIHQLCGEDSKQVNLPSFNGYEIIILTF